MNDSWYIIYRKKKQVYQIPENEWILKTVDGKNIGKVLYFDPEKKKVVYIFPFEDPVECNVLDDKSYYFYLSHEPIPLEDIINQKSTVSPEILNELRKNARKEGIPPSLLKEYDVVFRYETKKGFEYILANSNTIYLTRWNRKIKTKNNICDFHPVAAYITRKKITLIGTHYEKTRMVEITKRKVKIKEIQSIDDLVDIEKMSLIEKLSITSKAAIPLSMAWALDYYCYLESTGTNFSHWSPIDFVILMSPALVNSLIFIVGHGKKQPYLKQSKVAKMDAQNFTRYLLRNLKYKAILKKPKIETNNHRLKNIHNTTKYRLKANKWNNLTFWSIMLSSLGWLSYLVYNGITGNINIHDFNNFFFDLTPKYFTVASMLIGTILGIHEYYVKKEIKERSFIQSNGDENEKN